MDAGGCESKIAGLDVRTLLPYGQAPRTLQYVVKFILPFMHVGLVLLARFEAVQTGRELLAPGEIALAHFARTKFGALQDIGNSHWSIVAPSGPGKRNSFCELAQRHGPEPADSGATGIERNCHSTSGIAIVRGTAINTPMAMHALPTGKHRRTRTEIPEAKAAEPMPHPPASNGRAARDRNGDNDLFLDRELSLLRFQRSSRRGEGRLNPLLDRVKFLAIVGSNLNEIFMVRVSDSWTRWMRV